MLAHDMKIKAEDDSLLMWLEIELESTQTFQHSTSFHCGQRSPLGDPVSSDFPRCHHLVIPTVWSRDGLLPAPELWPFSPNLPTGCWDCGEVRRQYGSCKVLQTQHHTSWLWVVTHAALFATQLGNVSEMLVRCRSQVLTTAAVH